MARMLPREVELASELTGLPGEDKSVNHFQRSNGLDTALYKNIPKYLLQTDILGDRTDLDAASLTHRATSVISDRGCLCLCTGCSVSGTQE